MAHSCFLLVSVISNELVNRVSWQWEKTHYWPLLIWKVLLRKQTIYRRVAGNFFHTHPDTHLKFILISKGWKIAAGKRPDYNYTPADFKKMEPWETCLVAENLSRWWLKSTEAINYNIYNICNNNIDFHLHLQCKVIHMLLLIHNVKPTLWGRNSACALIMRSKWQKHQSDVNITRKKILSWQSSFIHSFTVELCKYGN